MYKIIGADQKEYGPVSGDQLRQWITEGRVNAQTQACAEGSEVWQPLSAFPEFAALLAPAIPRIAPVAPAAPATFQTGEGREAALRAVKGPAIALIVVAIIGIIYYCFSGIYTLAVGHAELPANIPPELRSFMTGMQGPMAGIGNLFIAALNGFVLFGAIKLLRLQNHGVAIAACIAAMLPCSCCCLFGLPFGIWALIVLNKPEVKSQFS